MGTQLKYFQKTKDLRHHNKICCYFKIGLLYANHEGKTLQIKIYIATKYSLRRNSILILQQNILNGVSFANTS